VILSIDLNTRWIQFDEHGAVLNDTTQYAVLEMNDTTIKGITTTKEGDDQRLEIDRISGRVIVSVDETRRCILTRRSIGRRCLASSHSR
jgi:hypothetical protein